MRDDNQAECFRNYLNVTKTVEIGAIGEGANSIVFM